MFTTTELFGRIHSPKAPLRQTRQSMAGASIHVLERLFKDHFPAGLLSQSDQGDNSRERVFSRRVTFWTFLWQTLNPGSSCRSALGKLKTWFEFLGLPAPSTDTSPYCQARLRLDSDTLERALRASALALGRTQDRHDLLGRQGFL